MGSQFRVWAWGVECTCLGPHVNMVEEGRARLRIKGLGSRVLGF